MSEGREFTQPAVVGLGDLTTGTVIDGRYHLERRISSCGHATHWCADDILLSRTVALRAIPRDDPAADNFMADARRASRLVHPGVASIYDANITRTPAGRVCYVVREWVDGESFAQLLKKGPLPSDQAAAAASAVADVLLTTEHARIVHGALHLQNVFLTRLGRVKVTDFAAAALRADVPVIGDRRALAGVLYACLTGWWPLLFTGSGIEPAAAPWTAGSLRRPRQVRAGIPRDLDRLAMTGLTEQDTCGLLAPGALRTELASRSGSGLLPASRAVGGPAADDTAPSGRLPAGADWVPQPRHAGTRWILPVVLLLAATTTGWYAGDVFTDHQQTHHRSAPLVEPASPQAGAGHPLPGTVRSRDPAPSIDEPRHSARRGTPRTRPRA